MYDEGKDRIDTELNIVKIIKTLRDLKILMKNSIMDDEIMFAIKHSQKNVINIEKSFSDSEMEEDK